MSTAEPLEGRPTSVLWPSRVAPIGRVPAMTRQRLPRLRRRVTQERIDRMAELRRQGVPYAEIGARLGCSERTARRYSGRVRPDLHLPNAIPDMETDPRILRDQLASRFVQWLHDDQRLCRLTRRWRQVDRSTREAIYGGPPSILFLSEAEHLLRDRLDGLAIVALRLLAQNPQSQRRFLQEVVGYLYWDYVRHYQHQNLNSVTDEPWRPPRERPAPEPLDDQDEDLDL